MPSAKYPQYVFMCCDVLGAPFGLEADIYCHQYPSVRLVYAHKIKSAHMVLDTNRFTVFSLDVGRFRLCHVVLSIMDSPI
jgi:hypothetical protein